MACFTRQVALPIAVGALLACSPHVACSESNGVDPISAAPTPLSPTQTSPAAGQVQVTDPEGLEKLRAAGTHDIRGPLDEVTVSVPCSGGEVDEQCIEAARQRLREAAAAREANLVVVVRSAVAQSFPVQYSVAGELYEITERR